MEKHEVIKISPEKEEKLIDLVATEIPLTIYINNEELATLLASPDDLAELAVGFAFTSGIIKGYSEIKNVTEDNQRWTVNLKLKNNKFDSRLVSKRMFTSGCGRGTLFYNAADLMHRNKRRDGVAIDRNKIFDLMSDFQSRSLKYKLSGCVHSAALADSTKILITREDIGRHNAVDKVLGHALIKGIKLKDKIILSSGRLSSEIVLKVQKTDLSVLISRSAPTNQAIMHAKESNITLIGFLRGKRMNVYSGKDKVL